MMMAPLVHAEYRVAIWRTKRPRKTMTKMALHIAVAAVVGSCDVVAGGYACGKTYSKRR